MPKAGGTSLRVSLANALGSEFATDYSDDPANPLSERNLDPARHLSRNRELPHGVRCLHGHFHPGQFKFSDEIYLFTILRNPIDNIFSIYKFWKSLASQCQPLHDYFLRERLDIIQMAQLPLMRRLYSYTYFGNFDMRRFDFIGRHENRKHYFAKLSDILGLEIDSNAHENITPVSLEDEELEANPKIRDDLQSLLIDDLNFYDKWAAGRSQSP